MKNKRERVEELLNKVFETKSISYEELNSIIPFEDKVEELRELEEENPALHLANYDTEAEGISTLSLIATITHILCDSPLCFVIEQEDEGSRVKGVEFIGEVVGEE